MKSMTAYTSVNTVINETPICFEIKSYNGRYLDLKVNLPFWLSGLEPFVREYFTSKILRGSVEISIRSVKVAGSAKFSVDIETVEQYNEAFRKIADVLQVAYVPEVETFVRQPGVLVSASTDDAEHWKMPLMPIFDLAFAAFDKAKTDEGASCQANIEKQLSIISAAVEKIKAESNNAEQMFTNMFHKKLNELVGQNYDENRLLQEVAIVLVKYTINEEIVRLDSHLQVMKTEIQQDGMIAKRLDFICQEINREINTVGSKNQSYAIAEQVVVVKEALENIREQLKNLE